MLRHSHKRLRDTSARDPRDEGADCDACPMKNCGLPVFGSGPPDAKLAVIGEGPGGDEVSVGIPFVGRSGELLESTLSKYGVRRQDVYFDNATLHMPPGGDLQVFLTKEKKRLKDLEQPYKSPIDCCRGRLFRALRVPKCGKCDRWMLGPERLRCRCDSPRRVEQGAGMSVRAVLALGNAALESVFGFSGVMDWRGSPIDSEKWARGER